MADPLDENEDSDDCDIDMEAAENYLLECIDELLVSMMFPSNPPWSWDPKEKSETLIALTNHLAALAAEIEERRDLARHVMLSQIKHLQILEGN